MSRTSLLTMHLPARFVRCSSLSEEEKAHLRGRLLDLVEQQDQQIAVQVRKREMGRLQDLASAVARQRQAMEGPGWQAWEQDPPEDSCSVLLHG